MADRPPVTRVAAAATRWSPGAPGPRRGTARLYYTAMVGPAPNYHFIVSYSDNEGRTWHQGFIADNTRGWSIGIEDLVVDTNRSSPNYGAVYLAYNWPKDPNGGDGLHVVASGDYGHTFAETEIPKVPHRRAIPTPGGSATSSRPPRTGRRTWRATSST